MTQTSSPKIHKFDADDSFMIKVRNSANKWIVVDHVDRFSDALDIYNSTATPRMLIGPKGIMHKQYSNDGFVYRPAFTQADPIDFDYIDYDMSDIDWNAVYSDWD